MQKLSQTEELARSLAAKARRHTLTPEQISRAMEETDFDVAQLDELYAALEQRGVHLAEEPAELPVLDDAQIGRLENELSSEGVALDDPVMSYIFVTCLPTSTIYYGIFCFESRNIDIGGGIEYDMDRFPTIRERTVYRIVMAKFRSSTMFSMK